MAGNTFGRILKVSTFGESHGVALGGVLDGVPAGIEIDFEAINYDLRRRKPGQSKITTQRKEDDEVEFLSGIFEGKTTGTSIGFIIKIIINDLEITEILQKHIVLLMPILLTIRSMVLEIIEEEVDRRLAKLL